MRRRTSIAGLGSATAWPLAVRAQQGERMRRIGVLMNLAEDDPDSQARLNAFRQALQELGWTDSRNLLIEYRWGAADVARARNLAVELVTLAPDVILVIASPAVTGLQQVTRTVPIVFVNVVDPVGAGFVASLARPGGNTTGFTAFEYSLSGKWLEVLKQITPGVTRVAVFRDPAISSGIGQFAVIPHAAPGAAVRIYNKSIHAGFAAHVVGGDIEAASHCSGTVRPRALAVCGLMASIDCRTVRPANNLTATAEQVCGHSSGEKLWLRFLNTRCRGADSVCAA
jgi:ABC-type uncharacterized transport system substrate-binding protein